jgi:hypothetical protein
MEGVHGMVTCVAEVREMEMTGGARMTWQPSALAELPLTQGECHPVCYDSVSRHRELSSSPGECLQGFAGGGRYFCTIRPNAINACLSTPAILSQCSSCEPDMPYRVMDVSKPLH